MSELVNTDNKKDGAFLEVESIYVVVAVLLSPSCASLVKSICNGTTF